VLPATGGGRPGLAADRGVDVCYGSLLGAANGGAGQDARIRGVRCGGAVRAVRVGGSLLIARAAD